MSDNPFQTPTATDTQYYSVNLKHLSFASLWRICRLRKFVGVVLMFPLVVLQKCFRINTRAIHGLARPTQLFFVADEAMSEDVHAAFGPFDAACGNAGMFHVCNNFPEVIGVREDLTSIWVDTDGKFCAMITFIELSYGKTREIRVLFGCTTWLDDGTEIQTNSMKVDEFIPDGIRPECHLERLANDTPPEEVIARHKERISAKESFVYLTEATAQTEYLRSYQLQFDYLVKQKLFRPLSPIIVQRLQRVDPIAKKGVLVSP